MSAPVTAMAFSVHAAAYWAARGAYEKHRDECQPESTESPLQLPYEAACEPLITAMLDAAQSAVRTPAASTAEIAAKLTIVIEEEMHNNQAAKELIEFVLADAKRIGGVA